MAAVSTSDLLSVLATIFEEEVTPQWNRATVLANVLPKSEGTSRNINVDVEDADGQGATGYTAYTDGTDIASYTDDAIDKASLEYVICQDAIQISDKAIDDAAATGNPGELEDLLRHKVKLAAYRVFSDLNKQLWLGNPAATPAQVSSLLDPAKGALLSTGVYAGIDKSSKTLFQSNYLGAGGVKRPLTYDLLRAFKTSIYNACGEDPTIFLSDASQWDRYAALHQNLRQFVTFTRDGIAKQTLDGGVEALAFDGIVWLKDKDCPAGNVVALNTNHTALKFERNQPTRAGERLVDFDAYPESQAGSPSPMRIPMRITPLAESGLYRRFSLNMRPQLIVRRPNACGVLTDLVP